MGRKQAKEDPTGMAGAGRRWRRPAPSEPHYGGLGERVIKILSLAEAEARDLREEAQRAAAAIIEQAERDAARIRAEAEADARALRAGGPDEVG